MPKDRTARSIEVGDLVEGVCPEVPHYVNGIVRDMDEKGNRVQIACITHKSSLTYTIGPDCTVICPLYWVPAKDFKVIIRK